MAAACILLLLLAGGSWLAVTSPPAAATRKLQSSFLATTHTFSKQAAQALAYGSHKAADCWHAAAEQAEGMGSYTTEAWRSLGGDKAWSRAAESFVVGYHAVRQGWEASWQLLSGDKRGNAADHNHQKVLQAPQRKQILYASLYSLQPAAAASTSAPSTDPATSM